MVKTSNHFHVRYEDLLTRPFETVSELFEFIRLPINDADIATILNETTFEKLQIAERNNTYRIGFLRPTKKNDLRSYKVRDGNKKSISYFINRPREFYLPEIQ